MSEELKIEEENIGSMDIAQKLMLAIKEQACTVYLAWHKSRWWKSTIRVHIDEVLGKHKVFAARCELEEVWNKTC